MLELYTLNTTTYDREVLLDSFVSVIWTERYIDAGDMKLVVPATRDNLKLLYPGRLLELNSSREPMLVHTRSIENGMLTVSGNTLETVFNDITNPYIQSYKLEGYEKDISEGGTENRLFNQATQNDNPQKRKRHGLKDTPEVVMGQLVERVLARFGDGPQNPPFMIIQPIEPTLFTNPNAIEYIIPEKDIYDALLSLAKTYKIGMSVRLVRYEDGSKLVFSVYPGVDLTSKGPNAEQMVRFSPELQNLANVKELQSVSGFKNVVIMRPPTHLTWMKPWRLRMYSLKTDFWSLLLDHYQSTSRANDYAFRFNFEHGTALPPTNVVDWNSQNLTWFRYVRSYNPLSIKEILVDCEDITEDMLGDSTHTNTQKLEVLLKLMKKRAVSVLNDHRKVNLIDGEVPQSSLYRYRFHYDLGDLVEMEGHYGNLVTGRVTEYIRSSDNSGAREYPTIVAEDPEAEKVSPVGGAWKPDGV